MKQISVAKSTMTFRQTRQKDAIQSVLRDQESPLLPDEILHKAMEIVPSLGIATVYRTLKSMMADGTITCVEIPGQPPLYERSDKGHHHHFLCKGCHKAFDLHRCVEGLKKMVPAGFCLTDHELTLFGFCSGCSPLARAL